ncbi:MAG: carbohydrate ABC transporter permease [Spirochaetes bacterium]|nr:carbohydrate ABC transporter permease [Spirochaetota bacterium]
MARKIFIYIAAAVVFLFSAGPLILTALGGVIPESALLSSPPRWFSEMPSLENYKYIFFGTLPTSSTRSGTNRAMISEEARQIPRAMLNSAIIAVSVMAVNIVFASMAAYAFARMNFRGKQATFMGIVMCRLIPAAALVVPFYLIVQAAGLLDTMAAIILVHSLLTLPFSVLILSLFFRKIPVEIEESARVDGATPVQIFRKITLPLSASSIVATGLFAFMLSYSEFLYALVLGGTEKSRTISVTMAALSTNPDMAWGLLMAGVFLTLIPTLILVIIVWKFVVENIILGASKY